MESRERTNTIFIINQFHAANVQPINPASGKVHVLYFPHTLPTYFLTTTTVQQLERDVMIKHFTSFDPALDSFASHL